MKIKFMSAVLGVFALVLSSTSWSADLPLENRLSPILNSGAPAVGFTEVDIVYKPGKTKKRGNGTDTVFFAESSASSVLTLIAPTTNYPVITGPGADPTNISGVGTHFDGDFLVDAKISPKGTFKEGTFGFWSLDPMFSSEPLVDYNCNKNGRNCDEGYLVYGGDIAAFGWSDSLGILEFSIINQDGWAWDLWGGGIGSERIIMQVGPLGINDANAVTSWTASGVYGLATIPVPAAVWLFGSGLIGLVGIARRKRA